MLSISDFRAIQFQAGSRSQRDAEIAEEKDNLRYELTSSLHYSECSTRNGVTQPLILTQSQTQYKANIEAMPDDELCVGDIVEFRGNTWLVYETQVVSPFQITGVAWLCNCVFRWQNFSSDIVTCHGVLDSGVFSTTMNGSAAIQTEDKQYNVYLPLNDDTKKLYVDKRLAVGTEFDKNGNEILETYKITGYNSKGKSYGVGAHLLILNVRSSEYLKDVDSIDAMICDYIAPESSESITEAGTISGPTKIRLGLSRSYAASFDVSSWSVSPLPDGVSYISNGNTLNVSIGMVDDLLGETITIGANDANGARASIEVVVS